MNLLVKQLIIFSLALCAVLPAVSSDKFSGSSADRNIYADLPFRMPEVERPSFPDYSVSVTEFGAKGDGTTLNTEAINNTIRAVNAKGGGTVVIPAGIWLTGPVVLLSHVNLYTEKNALVVFTSDFKAYPVIKTSFEGQDTYRCQSPISARNAENIAITGYGTFDGSGDSWRPVKKGKLTAGQWKQLVASGGVLDKSQTVWYPTEGALKGASVKNLDSLRTQTEWDEIRPWLRPVMLSIVKSSKVLLEGVTFKNSPGWCLHPLSCEHVTISGVKVFNPWYSQNGDALDLESCNYAVVTDCLFDAGDDAICIKSGKDEDGRRRGEPCQNVVVRNNTVLHGHGGFVVGSEMSGGVRNIYVSDCTFIGTDVGLRFKSARGRGGVVENIFIHHINMLNIPNEALVFDLFYGDKHADKKMPVTEETPSFRNIQITDIVCRKAGKAMVFNGLPEMPVKNISVRNALFEEPREGILLNSVENMVLENIQIKNAPHCTIKATETGGLAIDGRKQPQIGKEEKIITL